MSRIGKLPVSIPAGVQVETGRESLKVKGPRGELRLVLRPEVEVLVEGGAVRIRRRREDRQARAYHGLTRALIANMVKGVTAGYERSLELVGVGWNVAVAGRKVVLNVGYCRPVELPIPDGIAVNCPTNTQAVVSGADKQAVGLLAAQIRAARPPEPYKGKGVRYKGEYVRLKAGKSFGS